MYRKINKYLVLFAVIVLMSMTAGIVSAATVTNSITYQGKLTNAAGSPLTGTYSVTFKFYDASIGGNTLSTDTHSVTTTNGLFTTQLTFDPSLFDGRALWLGIKVGSDAEMTPRQEIRPVPYALGLRPWVVGASFTTASAGTSTSDLKAGINISTAYNYNPGLKITTSGFSSEGINAHTFGDNGYGFTTQTSGNNAKGMYSHTTGTDSDGIYLVTSGPDSEGVIAFTSGTASEALYGSTTGTSSHGVYAKTTGPGSYGVLAETSGTNSHGVYAHTTGSYGAGMNAITEGAYSDGVYAHTYGDVSDAVTGQAEGFASRGVFASSSSDNSEGVYAYTTGKNSDGVYAYTTGKSSDGVHANTTGEGSDGVFVRTGGDSSYGVFAETMGINSEGVYAYTFGDRSDGVLAGTSGQNSHGVYTYTQGPGSYGVWAETSGTNSQAVHGYSTQDIGVGGYSDNYYGVYGHTTRSDQKYGIYTPDYLYAKGTQVPAADVAEYMPVSENVTPGTVLVIGEDGKLQPSTTAYDTKVAGIVSTSPGVTLGTNENGNPGEQIIAVAGRVPCRVDAKKAPVHVGDLLTTSDNPGYAMKAVPDIVNGHKYYPDGTILGKAMGTLESGTGTIEVLVTLQ